MSDYPPPAPPVPTGPPAPGWWLASDGRWYPPTATPGFGGALYGRPTSRTSGLAVASLALGITWLGWIGSVLAVVFGHIALAQVRDGTRSGRGMAVAGLVLGYAGMAMLAVFVVIAFTSDDWVST